MGTRNLTMVYVDGDYRIAQYGQWDGYPSGQGITALEFIRDEFKPSFIFEQLPKIRQVKQKEIDDFNKKVGSENGWLDQAQAEIYHREFPYLTRDNGAKVLSMIQNSIDEEIILDNDLKFAADSLFCEWAYVIDFDRQTFEVYEGFNKKKLNDDERFSFLNKKCKKGKPGDTKFYPIKHVVTFSLKELPTNEEFLNHPAIQKAENREEE